MRKKAQTDTRQCVRGEVLWQRLQPLFMHSDWDATALVGKTSAAAKLGLNAQADTITDPWCERWTVEQKAREEGTLALLKRTCQTCRRDFWGAWEAHGASQCTDSERSWALAESVLANSWAQEVALDAQETLDLIGRHRTDYQDIMAGKTWRGFILMHRKIGTAPLATGLAASDWENNQRAPDVINPKHVHEAAAAWADDHPEEAEAKRKGLQWQQQIPVMRSSLAPECMIIPARLFELWDSWKGPAELFEIAAITAVERSDHGSAKTKAGGFDDYWACITSL